MRCVVEPLHILVVAQTVILLSHSLTLTFSHTHSLTLSLNTLAPSLNTLTHSHFIMAQMQLELAYDALEAAVRTDPRFAYIQTEPAAHQPQQQDE